MVVIEAHVGSCVVTGGGGLSKPGSYWEEKETKFKIIYIYGYGIELEGI